MRFFPSVALFAAALAVFLTPLAKADPQPVDRVVAIVNDEVVTALELKQRITQARRQLLAQGRQAPTEGQLQKLTLDRLIAERLQLQLARETSIRVDDPTLERALARIAENNRLSLPDFRAAVEREGLKWERFREDIRTEITLQRLREREVDSKVYISEAEVDAFLANAASASNLEFQVAHILVRVPENASAQQWTQAQKKMDEVTNLLRLGDDFAKLAAAFSDGPEALQGGSLGWRRLERLPSLYGDIVGQLQPGQVSEVLRSAAGLHLVKLLDRRDAGAREPARVEQTHARHILIRTDQAVTPEEARRRLADLRDRVQHGADFAELARLYSNDGSAARGGDLGWVSPGDTVPEFERAMLALGPGEISEPIESPFGWHLIQVLEKRQSDVSAERKRFAARNALRERKADESYDDWLRQLRDRAYVEVVADQ